MKKAHCNRDDGLQSPAISLLPACSPFCNLKAILVIPTLGGTSSTCTQGNYQRRTHIVLFDSVMDGLPGESDLFL